MARQAKSLRLSNRIWNLVREEAKREGISSNAWIAEAVIARLTINRVRRGTDGSKTYEVIEEVVHDICREEP